MGDVAVVGLDVVKDATHLAVAVHCARELMADLAISGDRNAMAYFDTMAKVSRDIQRRLFDGVTAIEYRKRVMRSMLKAMPK